MPRSSLKDAMAGVPKLTRQTLVDAPSAYVTEEDVPDLLGFGGEVANMPVSLMDAMVSHPLAEKMGQSGFNPYLAAGAAFIPSMASELLSPPGTQAEKAAVKGATTLERIAGKGAIKRASKKILKKELPEAEYNLISKEIKENAKRARAEFRETLPERNFGSANATIRTGEGYIPGSSTYADSEPHHFGNRWDGFTYREMHNPEKEMALIELIEKKKAIPVKVSKVIERGSQKQIDQGKGVLYLLRTTGGGVEEIKLPKHVDLLNDGDSIMTNAGIEYTDPILYKRGTESWGYKPFSLLAPVAGAGALGGGVLASAMKEKSDY